jgi:signal transduction histidine kinase
MWADNEIRLFVFTAIGVVVLLLGFIIFFITIYHKKQVQFLKEQERMKFAFQQELLHSQLEIQEQTLKTISQEIHDNINQMLSLAKLNLALADAETTNPHPQQQKISDSFQLVKKSLQDLRHLSHSLNADYVSEMGLQRAIEYELEMINKTGIMNVILLAEGTLRRLDQQKELIFFRIVQESLNNIIKHADATRVEINIQYLIKEIILTISDNGKGVDMSSLKASPNGSMGMGIRNMNSRARLIGAAFNINSGIGKGTVTTLHLQE